MTNHKTTSDRVIRVTGCHDCKPYATEIKICSHPDIYGGFVFDIKGYIANKMLPDNCPLEKAEKEDIKEYFDELIETFNHCHVNNQIDDFCEECGLYLTHPIHIRNDNQT